MARHPLGPQAGRRARNRTYTLVLAGLLIVMVVAFYYGPFGRNEAEPIDDVGLPPGANAEVKVPKADEPAPVTPQVQPEPVLSQTSPQPAQGPTSGQTAPPPATQSTPQSAPAPAVEANPDAAQLIAQAAALINEKPSRIIDARTKLNESLRMPMSAQQRSSVKEQLSKLSDQWLFTRTVVPGDPLCESYLVKSGDSLETIGKQYKVPYEVLQQINNISRPEALPAGSTIKIIKGPFHAKVYRSTFTMDVYLQNTYVRSFPVGLGMPGRETPTGLWRVESGGKSYSTSWRDPDSGRVYQPEDSDYPLGSRWIALEGLTGQAKGRGGFGIHGTKEPEQIGKAGSRGCIRLHNGDVITVYNLLVPVLSQVEVAD